eukprot:TRINITY_DN33687_c1_g2_i1.p1 TRINITY_DN33687_c1_g2~~TRINITY_DN33687_c1_g2_i1.p1  ORF type:complete len:1314 (+),score=479.59 TRINITY_DN33687_c1_g2_i1:102-4043(+)
MDPAWLAWPQAAWAYVTGGRPPLSAPQAPRKVSACGNAIAIEWDPVADTGSPVGVGSSARTCPADYTVEVYLTTDGHSSDEEGGKLTDAGHTLVQSLRVHHPCCIIAGLNPDTSYDVRIRAHLGSRDTTFSFFTAFKTAPELRSTSFFRPPADRIDDFCNCFIAAEACYEDEPNLYLASILREHSIGPIVYSDLVSHGYAIFYKRGDPTTVYVAFRGSRHKPDMLDATLLWGERDVPYAARHPALQELGKFINLVRDPEISSVYFVGHSTGGTVAALVVARLIDMFDNTGEGIGEGSKMCCVTFGAPIVRAATHPRALAYREHFYQVFTYHDPVPRIPLAPYEWRCRLHAAVQAAAPDAAALGRYLGDVRLKDDGSVAAQLQRLSGHLAAPGGGPAAKAAEWCPLGTLCVLQDAFEAGAEVDSADGAVRELSGPVAGFHGRSFEHHQLVKYALDLESARTSLSPDGGDWLRGEAFTQMEPFVERVAEQRTPACNCVGNTLEVHCRGKNLLYTRKISLLVPGDRLEHAAEGLGDDAAARPVEMQLREVRMHCVTATVRITDFGRPSGSTVRVRLETDFGATTFDAHLTNHEDFEPVSAHAEMYEDMPTPLLLRRMTALSLMCDEQTAGSALNTAAHLLVELERVKMYVKTNVVDSRLRVVDKVCILNLLHNVRDCELAPTIQDPLADYFRSDAPSEEEVVQKVEEVMREVEGALECDWMFSLARSDPAKIAIFAAKVGLMLSGAVAMMTPAGPAVAISEALAVSSSFVAGGSTVIATGLISKRDYEQTVPFKLGSYQRKLDFAMGSLGFPVHSVPHTLYYKEVVVYRKVQELLQRHLLGEIEPGRPLTRCATLRSFLEFFTKNWARLFPPEEGDSESVLCKLETSDRPLFAALLWNIVLMHESRRLLMRDFALHVVGTKNVGKSTLIREVFGKGQIVCGGGIDDATLLPTAYRVPGMRDLRLVDHPGSDDLHTLASRVSSQSYQLASHFLLLADFHILKCTSFMRLLIVLQCAGVPYTVVVTKVDDVLPDYPQRDELYHEVAKLARNLNDRLMQQKKLMQEVHRATVAARRPSQDEAGGGTQAEQEVGRLQRQLDSDLRDFLRNLQLADLQRIKPEDCARWVLVSLSPRQPNRMWMQSTGVSLREMGVLDCAALRGLLQGLFADSGMPHLHFPAELPVAEPPPPRAAMLAGAGAGAAGPPCGSMHSPEATLDGLLAAAQQVEVPLQAAPPVEQRELPSLPQTPQDAAAELPTQSRSIMDSDPDLVVPKQQQQQQQEGEDKHGGKSPPGQDKGEAPPSPPLPPMPASFDLAPANP